MCKVAAVALIALTCAVAGPATAETATTYVTYNCRQTAKEPSRIMFACGDGGYYVDHLHWSSWGTTKAKGRGVFHANDCKPDCASGTFHSRKGTLVLQYTMLCPKAHRKVFKHAEAIYDKPWNGVKKTSTKMFCPI